MRVLVYDVPDSILAPDQTCNVMIPVVLKIEIAGSIYYLNR